jgi:hypothetical protein
MRQTHLDALRGCLLLSAATWHLARSACIAAIAACLQEWESVAAGYTNSPNGVTLDLLKPSHEDEAVPSHALSTAMTHALDMELHQHMQQQRDELDAESAPAADGIPSSPFSAAAGSNPFSGTGPAPAAAPVAAAGVLMAPRLERLTVRAKLLLAADGPMSLIRQQCIGDAEPNFEVGAVWPHTVAHHWCALR